MWDAGINCNNIAYISSPSLDKWQNLPQLVIHIKRAPIRPLVLPSVQVFSFQGMSPFPPFLPLTCFLPAPCHHLTNSTHQPSHFSSPAGGIYDTPPPCGVVDEGKGKGVFVAVVQVGDADGEMAVGIDSGPKGAGGTNALSAGMGVGVHGP